MGCRLSRARGITVKNKSEYEVKVVVEEYTMSPTVPTEYSVEAKFVKLTRRNQHNMDSVMREYDIKPGNSLNYQVPKGELGQDFELMTRIGCSPWKKFREITIQPGEDYTVTNVEVERNELGNAKYLFLGNPGVGKSTLLNGFYGAYNFPSGVSIGSGLTMSFKKCDLESGGWVGDTPGLDDISDRKLAEEHICKALKEGGEYKIFFVVVLNEGRVRPCDKATMCTILNYADMQIFHYGIIINKVSKKINKLLEDKVQMKKVEASLTKSLPGKSRFFINPYREDLREKDGDEIKHGIGSIISPKLRSFIAQIPRNKINPGRIQEKMVDWTKCKEKVEEDQRIRIIELNEIETKYSNEKEKIAKINELLEEDVKEAEHLKAVRDEKWRIKCVSALGAIGLAGGLIAEGAVIGSVTGPVGAVLGASVGGVIGWFLGLER